MDSAVVLAYCGGVYHYLRWTAACDVRAVRLKPDATSVGSQSFVASGFSRTIHVAAVALYFVLGFMTKFVAVLFLPMILGVTALMIPAHRRALTRGWRTWVLAAVLAIVLIAPWFVFASVRFGSRFWQNLLGVHVYQRFTSTLDPGHLHPWHYYLGQMFAFWESGALVLVAIGFALVAGWTARRHAPSTLVLLVWLVLPLAAISAGTSKLYHYAFPFLPALALMGGYAAALLPALAWASFDRALDRAYALAANRAPRLARTIQHRSVRVVLLLALALSIAVAVGSIAFGRVELMVGTTELASAGVLRPGIAAFVFGALLMPSRRYRRWLLWLLVVSVLPLQGYRDSLALLGAGTHPRRSVSSCISAVQARSGSGRGLRVDDPVETISHSIFYYFDRVQPWRHGPGNDDIPALVRSARPGPDAAVSVGEGMVVTLPPSYAACRNVAGAG
jgi:4-amino-4-deoxy-L-arabinose transferase-like glycosyltransferase